MFEKFRLFYCISVKIMYIDTMGCFDKTLKGRTEHENVSGYMVSNEGIK